MKMARTSALAVCGVLSVAAVAYARVSYQDERDFQDLANRLASQFGAAQAQSTKDVFSSVVVANSAGNGVVGLFADSTGTNGGLFGLSDRAGAVRIVGGIGSTDGGLIGVFNSAGHPTYLLDADAGLVATSGDLAETFPTRGAALPGSVLVIDPMNRGAMRVADAPYDRRVAGVVAGANAYKPAITLRGLGDSEGRLPVTLSGTAYCLATNSNGAIKAGDLLTTSSVAGHAMKVTDYEAARGAILGKALEDLRGDKGSILSLASLQ
jgi:hypothetical protein